MHVLAIAATWTYCLLDSTQTFVYEPCYVVARVCRINIHKYICYCMRPLVGNTYTVHTEVSKINPFFWPAATAKTATFTFVLMPDQPVRYKR